MNDRENIKYAQKQSGETEQCVNDKDILLIPEEQISHIAALNVPKLARLFGKRQHAPV
jgi:hypothetical protein